MLVFFIILIFFLLIYFSGITIKIEELEIEKNKKIEIKNVRIKVYFLLLNKIKSMKILITKKQIEKINFNKILDRFKGKSIKQDRNIIVKNLEELKIKVEAIKIDAKLGLKNAVFLAYFVAIINIIFSIVYAKIAKKHKENYMYKIEPYQTHKFYLKLSINCIINVKIANIINMIIKNRSEDKYERTSNRSLDGNSYEQHSRYGGRKYNYRNAN